MNDLPPYLTHSNHRNIRWTGHATFPRRAVKLHEKWQRERQYRHIKYDLRIFKWVSPALSYRLMTDAEISQYMEDPTYV